MVNFVWRWIRCALLQGEPGLERKRAQFSRKACRLPHPRALPADHSEG